MSNAYRKFSSRFAADADKPKTLAGVRFLSHSPIPIRGLRTPLKLKVRQLKLLKLLKLPPLKFKVPLLKLLKLLKLMSVPCAVQQATCGTLARR